jgi:ubiquinol-cytochrome c reductase cytochrome b subunit
LPYKHKRDKAKETLALDNYDLKCLIIGSLLGDANAEKRSGSTRITFYQEDTHLTYLLWFHEFISKFGICNPNPPVLMTRLGNKGKIRQICRFKTYSYSNLNWIHDGFYVNKIKIVPNFIEEFLSPLALAVWIMDDGGKVSSGIKFATNSFTKDEVQMLANILNKKYGLKASVISAGALNQYNIYISSISMPLLAQIVFPHLHPSMYYKLNGHI